ncbi:MAG: hypothetical protein FD123_2427 [Bacteroidetes bacterium]|nr:MAG: hypothetical protein FD123_2427 [Bacteroidota bacterium]
MTAAVIISALALGFMGSLHCIGMCGPLALALPVYDASPAKRTAASLLYNAGRLVTYAALGMLMGLAGKSISMAGWQQGLSITAGVLVIFFALVPEHRAVKIPGLRKLYAGFGFVRMLLAKLFAQKKYSAYFSIGLLNGLLPCGLVYVALAAAIATGDPLNGAVFMALFGAGTTPAMFSVVMLAKMIPVTVRGKIRKAVPVIMVVMGLLLVMRGMNLGIPYLSPQIENNACHHCCH